MLRSWRELLQCAHEMPIPRRQETAGALARKPVLSCNSGKAYTQREWGYWDIRTVTCIEPIDLNVCNLMFHVTWNGYILNEPLTRCRVMKQEKVLDGGMTDEKIQLLHVSLNSVNWYLTKDWQALKALCLAIYPRFSENRDRNCPFHHCQGVMGML